MPITLAEANGVEQDGAAKFEKGEKTKVTTPTTTTARVVQVQGGKSTARVVQVRGGTSTSRMDSDKIGSPLRRRPRPTSPSAAEAAAGGRNGVVQQQKKQQKQQQNGVSPAGRGGPAVGGAGRGGPAGGRSGRGGRGLGRGHKSGVGGGRSGRGRGAGPPHRSGQQQQENSGRMVRPRPGLVRGRSGEPQASPSTARVSVPVASAAAATPIAATAATAAATSAIGPDPAMLRASETSLYQSRIRDGLCPTCGVQLFELKKPGLLSKKSSMKRVPINIDGRVFGGQCLKCNRPGGAGHPAAASASSAAAAAAAPVRGSGRDFNNSLNLGSGTNFQTHMQPDVAAPPGQDSEAAAQQKQGQQKDTSRDSGFDLSGTVQRQKQYRQQQQQQMHQSHPQPRSHLRGFSGAQKNSSHNNLTSSMLTPTTAATSTTTQLQSLRNSLQTSTASGPSSPPSQRPSLADANNGTGGVGESNRSVSLRSLELLHGSERDGISAIPEQGKDFTTDDKKRQLLIEQEILLKQFQSSRLSQSSLDIQQQQPNQPLPNAAAGVGTNNPRSGSPPAKVNSGHHRSDPSLDKGVGTDVTKPFGRGGALGRQSSARRGMALAQQGRSASQQLESVDERLLGGKGSGGESEAADPVDEVDALAIQALNPDEEMMREQTRIMEEIQRRNDSKEKKITDKALNMSGEAAHVDKFEEQEKIDQKKKKSEGEHGRSKRKDTPAEGEHAKSGELTEKTGVSSSPPSSPATPRRTERDNGDGLDNVDIDLLDANTTSDEIAAFAAKPKGARSMEAWSKERIGKDGKGTSRRHGDVDGNGAVAAHTAEANKAGASADRRSRRHGEDTRRSNGANAPTDVQIGDGNVGSDSDISEDGAHPHTRAMQQIDAMEERMVIDRLRKQGKGGRNGGDEAGQEGNEQKARSRAQGGEIPIDVATGLDADALQEQEAIMRDIDRKKKEKERESARRHRRDHSDKKRRKEDKKDRPPVPMTIAVPPSENEYGDPLHPNVFDEDLRDGCKYTGDYNADGLRHGRGTLAWENGDRYEGQFYNGMRHGVGKLAFADGSEYDGWWRYNRMDGHGTRRFPNGNLYVGNYTDGRRNGQGRHVFANGDQYVGEFRDDAMHGTGRYYFKNNESFEGVFNRGRKEGHGKYQWSDGTVDIIRYSGDIRIGEGVRYSADRKKAWKLEGAKVKGKISLDKAQKLVERLSNDPAQAKA